MIFIGWRVSLCMNGNAFWELLTLRYFDCIHFFGIKNETVMNILEYKSLYIILPISVGKSPKGQLLCWQPLFFWNLLVNYLLQRTRHTPIISCCSAQLYEFLYFILKYFSFFLSFSVFLILSGRHVLLSSF